jgi:hypothetical protein
MVEIVAFGYMQQPWCAKPELAASSGPASILDETCIRVGNALRLEEGSMSGKDNELLP